MRRIRLAVIFDQKIQVGGGYQQSLNAASLARALPDELAEVVFFSTLEENISTLAHHGIVAELIQLPLVAQIFTHLRRQLLDLRIANAFKRPIWYSKFEKILLNHRIDLVYFLSPSDWACDLESINYITTVWDLCHRDHPEFPEVRSNGRFQKRENIFRTILPRAVAILADSSLGKANIIRRYGIDSDRVHIMPFEPGVTVNSAREEGSSLSSIREKYQLTEPYVFYPAQFWAHKNHVYLLEGLKCLEDRFGHRVGAIFSGSDMGNLQYIQEYAAKLGLSGRVKHAGFVTNEEIPQLYRQSIALVMPSYFGPTNLPPLEAFSLGVPVFYPDKPGLRDQVGDAAFLMDLNDPGSMALSLKNLIENKILRDEMIDKGRARLAELNGATEHGILESIITEFSWKRAAWR